MTTADDDVIWRLQREIAHLELECERKDEEIAQLNYELEQSRYEILELTERGDD